jgi:hypothetical protein
LKAYNLVLAALLAFSFLCHAAIFWIEKDHIVSGYGDFIIFYTGAQAVNAGHGAELYDLSQQAKLQGQFSVDMRQGPLPYNHLPYEILLFLPLAKMAYPHAYGVWTLVNLLLLYGIYRLLLPFVDPKHKILVAGLLIAFYPTAAALLQGQDSILSTFLMAAVFASLKKQRNGTAGILLAMGLYKPQLVLPLAALLSLKRRWRAVFAFAATATVLALISFAIVGWTGFVNFFHLLSWLDRSNYTIFPASMANIRGLAEIFMGRLDSSFRLSNLLLLMIYVPLFAWAVVLWKGEWDPAKAVFDLGFCHLAVTALLLSHHLYVHDLMLLVIPLVLMLNYVLAGRTHAMSVRVGFLTLVLLFYCSIAGIWLLKQNLFAWVAVALLVFALIVAKEIQLTRKAEDLVGASVA